MIARPSRSLLASLIDRRQENGRSTGHAVRRLVRRRVLSSRRSDQDVAELRDELLREPGKASRYVRLQPVYTEGKLQGYRLYPGSNRTLFQSVGLRAGEMVTSVNGVQLDDAAKALQLLGDLREVSQLTLTLDRGGETRTVNLNLTQ